jgi:hypothetical protein
MFAESNKTHLMYSTKNNTGFCPQLTAFIIHLLFCWFIISCESKRLKVQEQTPAASTGAYILIRDSLYTPSNGKEQGLTYKFNVDTSGYFLNSILVYLDGKKQQEIIVNQYIEKNHYELIDWNFDGNNDITVLISSGSGGNSYLIWNYDAKTKKYDYNKNLSERIGLGIDTVSKLITIYYRAGANEELRDTFRYVDGKLVSANKMNQ